MTDAAIFEEHCAALLLYWIQDKARSNMFVFTPKSAADNLNEDYGLSFTIAECKAGLEILNNLGCVITYYSPLTNGQYRVNYDYALRRFGIGTWVQVGDEKLERLEGAEDSFPIIYAYLKGQGHWAKNVIAEIGQRQFLSGSLSTDTPLDAVPAADRFVPINHNEPDYAQILNGIDELSETIRTTNDLPVVPEERERILNALDAAKIYLQSAQLRFLQYKVGILLAVEDAAKALASTAKAAAAALLVDAVKAFFRNHTGLDLDNI